MSLDTVLPFMPTGPYPVRSGNAVRPLVDGKPAFRRICEAIESARHSVWVTVTFMWPSFQMPDGLGSALDVLDQAARRGVDVRVIFWRPGPETESLKTNAFWGSDDHIAQLEARGSKVKIRWDQAVPGFCQHQKSWLIDDEIAFVGGINLNPNSVVDSNHHGGRQNHDLYVELAGPSTVDIQHNFAQRWNEASAGRWGEGSESELSVASHPPPPHGDAYVQVQRTAITQGEQTIFDQYVAALDAARRTIYIENQYITVRDIVECLHRALRRGVEVVCLVPAEPDRVAGYVGDEATEFFERWSSLGDFENFTLASIAGVGLESRRTPVYVHSKLMLIDDAWATVGSANLHRFSLFGNSEMNVSFQDNSSVRELRCQLFLEHLGVDTSELDDGAALRLFRQVASENRQRHDLGDPGFQGLAFTLDPATYGQQE